MTWFINNLLIQRNVYKICAHLTYPGKHHSTFKSRHQQLPLYASTPTFSDVAGGWLATLSTLLNPPLEHRQPSIVDCKLYPNWCKQDHIQTRNETFLNDIHCRNHNCAEVCWYDLWRILLIKILLIELH